jgi:hypothetical protein
VLRVRRPTPRWSGRVRDEVPSSNVGVPAAQHNRWPSLMRTLAILVVGSMTAACSVDPGDVALFEKTRVEEAIAPGQPLEEAEAALGHLGYSCHADGADSAGIPRTQCTLTTAPGNVNCSVTMRVQLSHSKGKLVSIQTNGSDRCA